MNRDGGACEVAVHGRFLEIQPARKLVYTWRWDGAFPGMPETTVTIDFQAVAGGTEIWLRQEALAMPFCVKHLSGWLAALDRIAPIVIESISKIRSAGLVPAGDHAI